MTTAHNPPEGAQRLPLPQLRAWESLAYGMFLHFGMSTFDGDELSPGDKPSTLYNPTALDVDQWIQVARDAGMKYAVLTAKHVAGHALWPTRQSDYHVGTSSNKTDVVEAFVRACEKHHVKPGLYYCSWDNHNRFGSVTPTYTQWDRAFTTAGYRDFQLRQVEELLTQYGPIAEMWIDIPGVLGHDGRRKQYDQIARLQPETVIVMNQGFGDGAQLHYNYTWPTDIMTIERWLPSSNRGYNPWHPVPQGGRPNVDQSGRSRFVEDPPRDYYISGEVCDPIGYDWFHTPQDRLRSVAELLGMRLIARERKVNFLLDVPPDTSGRIPAETVSALMQLQKTFERVTA